jgi:hypothetical protein
LLVVIWIAGGSPALSFIGFEPQALRLYNYKKSYQHSVDNFCKILKTFFCHPFANDVLITNTPHRVSVMYGVCFEKIIQNPCL